MNLKGYKDLQNALDVAAVDAQVATRPDDGDDLRYISVDIRIEASCDEPVAYVADVMNAFVASGYIVKRVSRTMEINYGPELKLLGFTDDTILFEDINARPSGSVELR